MPINLNKTPRGFATGLTGNKPTGIYIGTVMRNDDAQKMGRLSVWIPEICGAPGDSRYWIVASYASPFAGVTNVEDNGLGGSYTESQQAYGFWMVPPDTGNQVLVTFVNGETSKAYWFACLFQQYMNNSVPSMGMNPSNDPEMNRAFSPLSPPTTEYNKKTVTEGWKDNPPRPVFTPLAQSLLTQGLAGDAERGPASSSARRYLPGEHPERGAVPSVFGFSSPRGSGVVIDDFPENEFIRLRTRSGTQVLIHDTSGYIYMITREGNSWMELSDAGIDVYSRGPISMRSESDFNIQADGDVNIDAAGSLNMRSGSHTTMQAGGSVQQKAGSHIVSAAGGSISAKAGGDIGQQAGGSARMSAGGDISQASGGNNIRSAGMIMDNSGGASGSGAGDASVPGTTSAGGRSTIASRAPTHEPFDHPTSSYGYTIMGSGQAGGGGAGVGYMDANGDVEVGPAQPVPAKIAERAKTIYRMLKKNGWNDEQCAGVLGSWQQESNLDPRVTNGIGALGLAQWLGARRSGLISFAATMGRSYKDAEVQVAFFMKEMKSTEKRAYSKLKAATNHKDATTAMNFYERFGGFKPSNPTQGHEVGKRYQYAANHSAAIKRGDYA